jgi:membrane protease subunit (stomatin/prohibitin family)
MAIIDFVIWNPESDPKLNSKSDPVYAWKCQETNLSTYTQLIVNESQEAVLFSKGRILGKFGPGKYTLHTENLPLLRSLFGIPFGGKNPFTAEIFFVNKLMPLNIDWETDSMRFHDPDYKTMVPIIAKGRYGLKVTDAERFLIKLVGTVSSYTAAMLTDQFRGALIAKTKSTLLQAMQSEQIGVKSIGVYLERFSQSLTASMQPFWEDYGFTLLNLYVTSIDIDSTSPDGQKILEAMAQQSAQSIAGYTWQQGQSFEVAKEALSNTRDSGLLGLLMVSGGLGGGGGVGNAIMQPQTPSANQNQNVAASGQGGSQPPAARDVFCSNCSKKFSNTMKFCPQCGDPYTPCPRCGTDNDTKAKRCVTCGLQLGNTTQNTNNVGSTCSRCGAPLAPTVLFCPSCGMKTEQAK